MAGKPRKNPVTDDQIVEAYERLVSAQKVAKELGVSDVTVRLVLLKRGIERRGLAHYRQNARGISDEESKEAARLYEAGESAAAIGKKLGKSWYIIKAALKREGTAMRDNPAPLVREGETELILKLHETGMSQPKIGVTIGRSQSFVSRILRKNGFVFEPMAGERSHQWAGGRFLQGGYWRVQLDKSDPLYCMCGSASYVSEHRLNMARKLGRPLFSHETVHHIDGNRQNNDPSNLELRQGKHGKGAAFCCGDCGSRNIVPCELG